MLLCVCGGRETLRDERDLGRWLQGATLQRCNQLQTDPDMKAPNPSHVVQTRAHQAVDRVHSSAANKSKVRLPQCLTSQIQLEITEFVKNLIHAPALKPY